MSAHATTRPNFTIGFIERWWRGGAATAGGTAQPQQNTHREGQKQPAEKADTSRWRLAPALRGLGSPRRPHQAAS